MALTLVKNLLAAKKAATKQQISSDNAATTIQSSTSSIINAVEIDKQTPKETKTRNVSSPTPIQGFQFDIDLTSTTIDQEKVISSQQISNGIEAFITVTELKCEDIEMSESGNDDNEAKENSLAVSILETDESQHFDIMALDNTDDDLSTTQYRRGSTMSIDEEEIHMANLDAEELASFNNSQPDDNDMDMEISLLLARLGLSTTNSPYLAQNNETKERYNSEDKESRMSDTKDSASSNNDHPEDDVMALSLSLAGLELPAPDILFWIQNSEMNE